MGEAVRDSSGAIHLIQGAFQDLSDRKEAEHKAHRLATRLTTALESLIVAFFTVDCDWRFTYFNAEAERIFGRRREDLIGDVLWQQFPELLGTELENVFRRVAAEGRPISTEVRFPLPIGGSA